MARVVKLVKLDPPGTWCSHEAIFELVERSQARSFVEFGCGGGDLSFLLCQRGLTGHGYDFSPEAIAIARERMVDFIAKKRFVLTEGDASDVKTIAEPVDLAIAMMVIEHVEDDVGFLKSMARFVKPGGSIIVGVPGRRDAWCLEDETVGHLRRYDKIDLETVMASAGLKDGFVWSVAVPIANLLASLGNRMIRKSNEVEKKNLSLTEQTQSSGIREIPFKTVFPSFFRIVLNRFTLYPLFLIQRLFYRTGLGLTMIGFAKVDSKSIQP